MRTLATIFGALALMTWGVSAQEGSVPGTGRLMRSPPWPLRP